LMYLKSNNATISDRIVIPQNSFQLDHVRPDLLLLRRVVDGELGLMGPTEEWVVSQIPSFIRDAIYNEEKVKENSSDMELIRLAHVNLLAGACFALGLRFAGSAYQPAFDLLHGYCQYLIRAVSRPNDPATVGVVDSPIVENCINTVVLSLSLVMCGTGNLQVLRIIRQLRRRVPKAGGKYIHGEHSYGSHMALHMAAGFLFLGGGRYSVSTSDVSIATLVASLYPQWPVDSADNRYHLQALRHLYVIAAESRVLETVDVDNKNHCYVPIRIQVKAGAYGLNSPETTIDSVAPCLLPELRFIKAITIQGPRYWSQSIEPNSLRDFRVIHVKRRVAFLPYGVDPKGYRSVLSKCYPKEEMKTLEDDTEDTKPLPNEDGNFIESFSDHPSILAFARQFCEEGRDKHFYNAILYQLITSDSLAALPSYLTLKSLIYNEDLENVKLCLAFYPMAHERMFFPAQPMVQLTFLLSVKHALDARLLTRECHEQMRRSLVWLNVPYSESNCPGRPGKRVHEIFKEVEGTSLESAFFPYLQRCLS
ncbi:anaphase promoting complex subunit 1-like, partial [Planoprotostelium fungivorum]